MNISVPHIVRRTAVLIGCLAAAAWLIWRGNTFPDPVYDMTVPLMCVFSALMLVLTGLTACFRDRDREGVA